MQGLWAVYKKELADHMSSYRFVILFAFIALISFILSYMAGINVRQNLEGVAKPKFVFLMLFSTPGVLFSMVQFVAIFGPLIGLVLGFDAINRERAHGTLIKLVSQPIYRDAVINGKFLAGLTNIAIMLVSVVLVISGFGLILLGVVPGVEEILRLFVYLVISIFYISFWLGIAILFSISFRSMATSLLATAALWLFLCPFMGYGAPVLVANTVAPVEQQEGASPAALVKNARIREGVSLFSPMILYSNSAAVVVDPTRKTTRLHLMGFAEQISLSRFQNPLSLGQSIVVVYPHMVALLAITLICFAISYLLFMLQEIRT
ncbi:MAG: ABC transporter permease subunit [Desulfobacteraceae bacterium]|jgi:ABC-2 type transport system permease protein